MRSWTPSRRRLPTAAQSPRPVHFAALVIALIVTASPSRATQAPEPQSLPVPGATTGAMVVMEPAGEQAEVTLANRPIVTLRARVLGRSPLERATAARRILDDLVDQRVDGPVEIRTLQGSAVVNVGPRAVMVLTPFDIDELTGETLTSVGARTAARLRGALDEAIEARSAGRLFKAITLAAAGLVVGLLMLWGIARLQRAASDRLEAMAERKLAHSGLADLADLRASRVLEFQRGLLRVAAAVMSLFVVYSMITFVLRRFPYTRPWGESMLGFLATTVETLGLDAVHAIPGLFTITLIAVITRFLSRALGLWFRAIEQGRSQVRWIHPETAQPTRRLVTTLLWLCALVVSVPYMPGSNTEAFKGVSVFVGLMITIGSSGLVNQIMSGFMLTFSRALRVGDFVRIGDVDGTVIHLGVLSTKLRTLRGEDATIPNAVVVSQTTTDFSRYADTGVFTSTTVTIGYDAPWRQVHALLLLAAERTPGIRRDPRPMVLQMALEDFYVRYTLWVSLEQQDQRPFVLHTLHTHIQDLFNEYGVQIMSPNYLSDPSAPKVVPKQKWYEAPAKPD
jgi:small-conductance mechanosensitive channel